MRLLNTISEMNAFKDTFKCILCSKLVDKPIILPCGETICVKDLTIFFNNSKLFQCSLCNEEHELPNTGFPSNKSLQRQLDLQVNKIELGKNFPNYEKCKNMLSEIEGEIREIQLIQTDPESFVFGYFEKIINQVDIQREKLIEEINLYSEKTIETIKKTRDECSLLDNKIELISSDYEIMKQNLNKMDTELNAFDINKDKIEKIIANAENIKNRTNQNLTQIKNIFLLNKSYEFEPSQTNEININNMVGLFRIRLNEVFIYFFNLNISLYLNFGSKGKSEGTSIIV